jgi:hypothetical protein
MPSAFRGVSALIDVDFAWRAASPKVLRHPAAHQPADSRVVFHETVHYWQQVGQGFPAKLVEEDWERLRRYETAGALDEVGTYRLEFVRKQAEHGFSAHDLHESLARFWDVHVIGPHRLLELEFADPRRQIDEFFQAQYFALKERGMIVHPEHGGYSDLAYDMAMEAAAGSYALPYLYVRERFNSVVTGAVFPLAGHFALQTERPVDVFIETITEVAPLLAGVQPGYAIHDLWRACFPLVRIASLQAADELGVEWLGMAAGVVVEGALANHPVYSWVFHELERGRAELENTAFARELASGFSADDIPLDVVGVLALDFCLACPGDTTNRSFLVEWLAPPCVRFPDGQRWLLPELYRRELVPVVDATEGEFSSERGQAADDVVAMQIRWEAFLRAKRGY